MAHFAKLEDSKVTGVYVIDNNELLVDGVEQESKGIEFITQLMGDGTYVQTSYNTYKGVHSDDKTQFRKNYAGIDYSYDSERDAFIPPNAFNSWSLDEDTCQWVPPVPMPEDGKAYQWNEESQEWL